MGFLSKVLAREQHYVLPKIPDELKFGKTDREKQYLAIINQLLAVVKSDPMTGLTHKEHFRALEKSPGVFIMIDGDGLKKLNDLYGHEAGHAAILALAKGIQSTVRKGVAVDQRKTITRAGGDEFIVHIEGVSIPTGVLIANRILESIRRQKISDHYTGEADTKAKLEQQPLTASLGVGYTEAESDRALYKAKERGRNRVEFYRPTDKETS
jgi:diguanylate cyclase (GGDEF)-like protein